MYQSCNGFRLELRRIRNETAEDGREHAVAVPVQTDSLEVNPGSSPFEFYGTEAALSREELMIPLVPEFTELEGEPASESNLIRQDSRWNGIEEMVNRAPAQQAQTGAAGGDPPSGTGATGTGTGGAAAGGDPPAGTGTTGTGTTQGSGQTTEELIGAGRIPPLTTPLIPSIFPENPTFSVPANPLLPPEYREVLSYDSVQYLNGFLRSQIGRTCRVDFLLGTGQIVTKRGKLDGVGINYILLAPHEERNAVLACDFYSIKFVCFEDVLRGEGA